MTISAELTLAASSAVEQTIVREQIQRLAPEATVLSSAGSDDRGGLEHRLHISRGALTPRQWRVILGVLASFANEGET